MCVASRGYTGKRNRFLARLASCPCACGCCCRLLLAAEEEGGEAVAEGAPAAAGSLAVCGFEGLDEEGLGAKGAGTVP